MLQAMGILFKGHLFINVIGILSFGASAQLNNSQGVLALRMMGLYAFPSRIFIHVSNSDWCTNGPFFILEQGPWALCCVQILPSHNVHIKFSYSYILLVFLEDKYC